MMLTRPPLSLLALCLGLSTAAAAQQAAAGPPPPGLRLYLASLSIARYNPLGVETQNRLVLQKRLYESESLVMRDNFVSGALSLKANPASLKVGPLVELQPIAMLNVRAGYEYVQYFGTFGFLQSYPDSSGDYSDDTRDLNKDTAYSTSGHHFLVEPTVQARVKSFALRSKFALEYWNVDLRDGERGTFYDALLDTLVPGKGWVLTNDTDLLMLKGQWTLGARFSAVWPRYDGEGGATAVQPADNSHMRVGPLVGYSFTTKEGTAFNKPTLLLIAGWYLKHPNRVDALPYVLAGFTFTSDLLPRR